MGRKRCRHVANSEEGFGLGFRLLSKHPSKRKRLIGDDGNESTAKRAIRPPLTQRPLRPRRAIDHDPPAANANTGQTRADGVDGVAPGLSQHPGAKSIDSVPGQSSKRPWEHMPTNEGLFELETPEIITTLHNPFTGGVPANHNFSPPDFVLRGLGDATGQFSADYSSDLRERFMSDGVSIEDVIAPRRLVQVFFEDTDKNIMDFTAVFDPESEVSFACRSLVQALGKRSLPWKPVPVRGYQTLAGLIEPAEYAVLRTKAPEFGIDKLFPLKVAVLDVPSCAAFCFGRPAIEQMVLQFEGFKNFLQHLCGFLGDSVHQEPDDDDDGEGKDTLYGVDSLNDGSGAPTPKRPPAQRLNPPLAVPALRNTYLISPPLTQCTSSESKFAMQLAPNPLPQYLPISMTIDPLVSFWATDGPVVTDSSPVNNTGHYHYQPALFSQAGSNASLPVSASISQPLSSVGYTPITAFSLPKSFPAHSDCLQDGLN